MLSTRILQLTDLHVFRDPDARLRGIPTFQLLCDVVEHIKQSGEEFDFVVVTGDHTHDELQESYSAVRQVLSPWLDRLFQVPGNHDDRAVLRSVFSDRIAGQGDTQINFTFQAGNWLCLGLDTHVPSSVPGLIDAEQIAWAKERVRSLKPDLIGLFLHHPPVNVGSEWMDIIGLTGKELLQSWFTEEPRIRFACCGHVHHEFQTRWNQTDILTTPSTGIQFSPQGSTPTFVADPPGYRIIELNPEGYTTRVIRLPETRFAPVI